MPNAATAPTRATSICPNVSTFMSCKTIEIGGAIKPTCCRKRPRTRIVGERHVEVSEKCHTCGNLTPRRVNSPSTAKLGACMRFRTILRRALRLVCPACGRGRLFSGWFKTNPSCPECGLNFHPEQGYYLGAIYFNYGLTALILVVTFFALFFLLGISPDQMLWPLAAFCVIFPLCFFRYARSLWRAWDQFFDPDPGVPETGTGK